MDESKYKNMPTMRKDTFVLVVKDLSYENPIGNKAGLFKYVKDVNLIGYSIQTCLKCIEDPYRLVIQKQWHGTALDCVRVSF